MRSAGSREGRSLDDRFGEAHRRGAAWIRPGYRVTRAGRVVRAALRRLMAVTPAELGRRFTAHFSQSRTPPGAAPSNSATCPATAVVGEPTDSARRSESCQHPRGCS